MSMPGSVNPVEQVPASELKQGDLVYFPVSRHPQVVTLLQSETVAGRDVVSVHGEDVIMVRPAEELVRRVRP